MQTLSNCIPTTHNRHRWRINNINYISIHVRVLSCVSSSAICHIPLSFLDMYVSYIWCKALWIVPYFGLFVHNPPFYILRMVKSILQGDMFYSLWGLHTGSYIVFNLLLRNSKSSHVSRTPLNIQAGFNSTLVWLVLIFFFELYFCRPFRYVLRILSLFLCSILWEVPVICFTFSFILFSLCSQLKRQIMLMTSYFLHVDLHRD